MNQLKTWIIRIGIFGAGIGFVIGSLVFAYAYFTVKIPDANAFVNSQATIIEYADGSEIGRIGSENRTVVKLANIPLDVRHAVMAAEDRSYYSEHAFSPSGILRALYNDIKGGSLQGGSTITQQYAKTAFLTPQRSIQRKIKELVIAMKLESQFSKDQILESYLNTIYFGRGSYGVSTAAQVYFNRNVGQLTVSQAAVIASVLRSPGYYDPSYPNSLKRLKARWQYVIDGMVKAGWLDSAKAKNLHFPYIAKRTPAKAPSNLRIALVSIRPGTGEIVALYGGQDYLKQQLNNATQATTQAGSSFKPFALIAALEQGISLQSIWDGTSPHVYWDPGSQQNYSVSNYGNEQFPHVTLANATANSVNTVFVPLGMKVGTDKVIDVARRAGIPASVGMLSSPSVSLGVASPHVIDLASAYATFAAQGVYAKPFIVKEVLGSNQGILYESRIQAQQVFATDVMADLTSALQGVTKFGTASGALSDFRRPSAGKTGTTTDNAAAWFNGYTPQLATSVAMFRDRASQTLNGIGGLTSVTGGSFPARIWSYYTTAALKGLPVLSFPPPANIGGTTPTDMSTAVPTLDPALAATATPVATKPTIKK